MKRLRLLAMVLALTMCLPVWAQTADGTQSQGKQLSAMFGYSTFYIPNEDKPYVEAYLSVDAWTLNFVKDGSQYKATVEVTMIVRSGDSIVYWKKYNLNSPAISDPEQTNFNFVDLQRFSLPNGIFNVDLTLRDINSDAEATKAEDQLVVYYGRRKPALSSVQIMSSVQKTQKENVFSRGGYDMQPYVSDYIPEQFNVLSFYYEVYNIAEEIGYNPFMTYVYIEDAQTGRRAGQIQKLTKHKYAETVPEFTSLDISTLPSGTYNLVVEVHNKANENLMYKKVMFYRSNPKMDGENPVSEYASTFAGQITDENQMNYYLNALYPIASEQEKRVARDMAKSSGLEEKQAFFYKFWLERDKLNPADAWSDYRTRLEYVDKNFGFSRIPGYMTDRGRVYLQYGPPDYIRDEKNFVSVMHMGWGVGSQEKVVEGSTEDGTSQGQIFYKPYQLWRYNLLPHDDPTRCFIFWDEHRSGNYQLLNSNARGELITPNWERRLSGNMLEEDLTGEVGEQFQRGY